MFTKEWRIKYLNHEIVVNNGWSFSLKCISGYAKLYIDGKLVDENKDIITSGDIPILRGKITDGNNIYIVEVYVRSGMFKVMSKICINDRKIAGDDF